MQQELHNSRPKVNATKLAEMRVKKNLGIVVLHAVIKLAQFNKQENSIYWDKEGRKLDAVERIMNAVIYR